MRLRRTRVPQAVLAITDRRLAWGLTQDGVALVASPDCLHIGPDISVPWWTVERVGWAAPTLRVAEIAEVEGAGRVHLWELAEDHSLAATVRERVTASVAWSDLRTLSPAGEVRLVGRRVPDQEVLTWQAVWQAGTDPSDPLLRAQVDAHLDSLRKSIG
ncbi:MAG: hypothetical protein JWO22_773 [Frankiales bacterium]|nr:hypothetical protein [Frankiales bacterium]